MEAFLVLLGVVAAAYFLVAPTIAMVLASAASRRARELESRLYAAEKELADLRFWAANLAAYQRATFAAQAQAQAQLQAQAPAQAQPHPQPQLQAQTPAQAQPAAHVAAGAASSPAPLGEDRVPSQPPAPVAIAAASRDAMGHESEPSPLPGALPGSPDRIGAAPDFPVAPLQPFAPHASAHDEVRRSAPVEQPTSLEEQVGLNWLTRLGAAAFVLGALFFFKYAVDSEWIGPTGRVAIGGAVGAGLILTGELIRQKTRPGFVQALTGIGLAVLFGAVWASAILYDLLSIPAAFGANTLILFIGAALSLRHRGEAILVLSLVAGFLNPVILSTDADRPLELVAYLLLITTVAHAVFIRLHFRVVPWLAVGGVAILFGGWYAKYFDITAVDADPFLGAAEPRVGAYADLGSRVVPLLGVLVFTGQWIGSALWQHLRGSSLEGPDAASAPARQEMLALAGLIGAHAGVTMLLLDSPRALALGAVALAVASILALRALAMTRLLIAPMGAAFFALLAVSSQVPVDDPALLTGLCAAWAAIYAAGFVGSLPHLVPEALRGAVAARCATAAALFAILAGVLFAADRPTAFAAILAATSAFVALVTVWSGARWILLLTGAASALVILVMAPRALELAGPAALTDAAFLVAAAVWALVHFGAALVRPGAPGALPWSSVLAASVAGLGFLGAALLCTTSDVPMLRALLTAASGGADLALGAVILRRDRLRSEGATLLIGQALGLFAAAIAFGLGGATVTILWAVLATIAAAAAARSKQPLWLAITTALFLATLVRLGLVDAYDTYAVVARYFVTHGRDGVSAVPTLLNPRAYALAGAGVALIISARLLARSRPMELSRGAAAVAAVTGYALLLTLALTEARAAFTRAPAAPTVLLDSAEWLAWKGQYDAAIAAQGGSMAMTTTLVLGLFAAALLATGFIAKDAFHRYLGLALFLVTVGKLATWDVWHIERVYQIVLLTGIGALLVAGGFLYARFGQRLVALMREGPSPKQGAGLMALLFVLLAARGASAQPAAPTEPGATAPSVAAARYTSVRHVAGVDAPGDYRIDVDLDLHRESRSEAPLADVRIAGPDGAEVPYAIRPAQGPRDVEVIPSRILEPSRTDSDSVYATFEIGRGAGQPASAVPKHCKIALRVEGQTFLRRVRIETGEDRRKLELVAEGGYVYRIQHRPGSVEHLEVEYPPSRASLVRVTLIPEGAPSVIRIADGDVHCGSADPVTPPAWLPLRIEDVHHDTDAHQTVVTLDAGAEGVPLEALILDVGTAEFHRQVQVDATSYRMIWPDIGGGVIQRVRPRDGFALASTRVPLVATRKRWLRLTIDDRDDAPIELRGVLGEVRPVEIVFRAAAAGEHTLYVGDPLGQPARYDLESTLARSKQDQAPRPATMGPTLPNPRRGASAQAGNLPVSERYRGVIGVALAVVLVGLSIWAARLLRQSTDPG